MATSCCFHLSIEQVKASILGEAQVEESNAFLLRFHPPSYLSPSLLSPWSPSYLLLNLTQGSTNYSLWAKSNQLPVFDSPQTENSFK